MSAASLDLRIDNGKLLVALNKAPELLNKNMGSAIQRIIQNVARTARINVPKAFSQLTNSILPVMVTPLHGEVRTGTNYAEAVERGTGIYGPSGRASGKMPPLDDLIAWINVKQIQPLDPAMDTRSLAFVIGRSIAKTGTRAQPFMGPAMEENRADAMRRANLAISQTLKAMA
jgi:hypothetical protein